MSNDPQVTVSYLLLCHDSPARITRIVKKILSEDNSGYIVVHFDKNSSEHAYEEICVKLKDIDRCSILSHRVKCGWGQWSLVEATIRMLRYAFFNYKSDYYYLLSEYCWPSNKLSSLKFFLSKNKKISYIDCKDKSWITGGIREDRFLYRHFFDKSKHPVLHRYGYILQKKIGFKKKLPENIEIKYGSQWWCINSKVAGYVIKHNEYYKRYFKYAWIPDEIFFQTLAFSSGYDIEDTITYSKFDSTGRPIIYNHIVNFDSYFFFRKLKDNLCDR